MGTVGYIAIYIVTWAICLFAVLPWGVRNQSDTGDIVAGSEPGAPAVFHIWKKLLATTILAGIVVALIYWGVSNPVLRRYWG
jgi:predicted secreted protein